MKDRDIQEILRNVREMRNDLLNLTKIVLARGYDPRTEFKNLESTLKDNTDNTNIKQEESISGMFDGIEMKERG